MSGHAFFLALAYGLGLGLIALEALWIAARARRLPRQLDAIEDTLP